MLAIFSTILFAAGINIDENEKILDTVKTNILNEEEIENTQNEDFYRKKLKNEENEFFIIETDASVNFATESWIKSHEYNEKDIIGNNFFNYIHSKDLPYFANAIITFLDNKKTVDNIGPFRMITNNGEYTLFTANIIPLFDEQGDLALFGIILYDVSVPIGNE